MTVVGIDLGTSNTVVAWSDGGPAATFEVPQLTTAREVEARALLPSTLYAPLAGEAGETPFDDPPFVVGEWARRRGVEIAGRAIASHKSWLAHAGVDRTAALLPYGAEDPEMPRLSPVDAAERVLLHVRRAWDAAHPDHPLASCSVVLTVPASFDEVARELTALAAERAGLAARLLEEPQAAFYDRLSRGAPLEPGAVLVCDVGGGTTDLSLLEVREGGAVERVAVGRHLLLGGDNMDLALAHLAEPRMVAQGEHLDPPRFAQLVLACRAAKERLLGEGAPESARVSVLGAGAKLVGATRSADLGREEVERLVMDGFFPAAPRGEAPRRRAGLVAFGLPYEQDTAITRHVGAFLDKHGAEVDFVLPSGGVFNAARVRARLAERLSERAGRPVRVLEGGDPDLAVARGAAAYGALLARGGRRIASGAAKSYFIGLAGGRAICVLGRGAEEGARHDVAPAGLSLVLGRAVRFDLFATDERAEPGALRDVDDSMDRFPPLALRFDAKDAGRRDAVKETKVRLEAELTPIGTLDLACVGEDGERRRLAFQLRGERAPSTAPPSMAPASVAETPALPRAAIDLVTRVFGKAPGATEREVKDLSRELERVLGERGRWSAQTSRELFDVLARAPGARRRSADHERVFFQLAGFCVRPGFGHPDDPARALLLARLFPERLAFPAEVRSWQQLFIAYRRAAGGLDEAAQAAVRDMLDPFVLGAGGKKAKKFPDESFADAYELCAALERVPPARRVALGDALVERTWSKPDDARLWAAIGRVGARVPSYASAHHAVPAAAAERWCDALLRAKWEAASAQAKAAVAMARLVGDRARDVSVRVRKDLERRLVALGAPAAEIAPLREVVQTSEADRAAFFGEGLPVGLRLEEPAD